MNVHGGARLTYSALKENDGIYGYVSFRLYLTLATIAVFGFVYRVYSHKRAIRQLCVFIHARACSLQWHPMASLWLALFTHS